jgi:uncharacterized membrane protein
MTEIEAKLKRWQKAGALSTEAAERILALERGSGGEAGTGGLGWMGLVAFVLGAILLACGVVLFFSTHWDRFSPGAQYAVVLAMVAVLHLAGGLAREHARRLSTALHAAGTVAAGAAIAVVGQIFNIEAHWPAAVLVWALAALAGWLLLRDPAQQVMAILLVPAWLMSEIGYATEGRIGQDVYLGRALLMAAALYLLVYFPGWRRNAVRWILFAVGAGAAVAGIGMIAEGWVAWTADQRFLSFGTAFWAWALIAALPLALAAFKRHKGLMATAVSLVVAIALPWCQRTWDLNLEYGPPGKIKMYDPNWAAYLLVAAFAAFVCWWGARRVEKALVNLGIVGFAVVVAWFYFSDVFGAMGRSLGLMAMGVLFLAGGWALEKLRRRILAAMAAAAGEGAHEPSVVAEIAAKGREVAR